MARVTNLPNLSQAELQAFDAWILRALVWLLGVIARLGAPRRSALLHRIIRMCERNAEAMVFELAEARDVPFRSGSHQPGGAPSGFRLKRVRGSRFFAYARVRLPREAGFAARVRRLVAVYADPEPCVLRCLRLLAAGRILTRLVVAAPAPAPVHNIAVFAPAIADSS